MTHDEVVSIEAFRHEVNVRFDRIEMRLSEVEIERRVAAAIEAERRRQRGTMGAIAKTSVGLFLQGLGVLFAALVALQKIAGG